jgi:hypothetical protein
MKLNRSHHNPIRVGRLEIRTWDSGNPYENLRWWSVKCRGRRYSYVLKRRGTLPRRAAGGRTFGAIYTFWANR